MKYSQERKEAVLKKMMPPHNRSIRQLSGEDTSKLVIGKRQSFIKFSQLDIQPSFLSDCNRSLIPFDSKIPFYIQVDFGRELPVEMPSPSPTV